MSSAGLVTIVNGRDITPISASNPLPVGLYDAAGKALTTVTRGAQQAASVQIVDASGNQITTFGGAATTSNATSGVATTSTNQANVTWSYGFNGTTWDQLQVDSNKYLKTAPQASQLSLGNVGGKTASLTVNPTVTTANAYGTNFVVGGLLTFTNLFTSTGSGLLQGVTVTMNHVETNGFTFVPFNSNPSNTTWTDAAAANINSADIAKARSPISLAANSQLGTMSIYSASGLGQAWAPGATAYGVLLANAALTNNFTSASEVNVVLHVLQDA